MSTYYRHTLFYCSLLYSTSQVLHFFFTKWSQEPPPGKRFLLTLLWWSGTQPTKSPKCVCMYWALEIWEVNETGSPALWDLIVLKGRQLLSIVTQIKYCLIGIWINTPKEIYNVHLRPYGREGDQYPNCHHSVVTLWTIWVLLLFPPSQRQLQLRFLQIRRMFCADVSIHICIFSLPTDDGILLTLLTYFFPIQLYNINHWKYVCAYFFHTWL